MSHVAHVLEQKGSQVHEIGAGQTVYEAIEKMVAHEIGSLVVVDGGAIVGIVTERDYLKKVALKGRSSRTTAVAEIMTKALDRVRKETPIAECLATMTARRERYLLVADQETVGIVSIGDLVKYLVRDQKADIERLTEFICNRYPA